MDEIQDIYLDLDLGSCFGIHYLVCSQFSELCRVFSCGADGQPVGARLHDCTFSWPPSRF